MRTRLLAAAILFCVYIGAPFVAPKKHTALAAQYCFCSATADMYENNGGAYLGQQTYSYNVGQRNNWIACQDACWHTTFQWGEGTVCPSGDIQDPDAERGLPVGDHRTHRGKGRANQYRLPLGHRQGEVRR